MKTIFCCLALAVVCFAQEGPSHPLSLTGTQCGTVSVQGKATVAFQVTGSWTGTIQPGVSFGGQDVASTQVTPTSSTTAQSTVTANGAYFTTVAGYTLFSVCGNTITGTAKVFINASKFPH